MNIDQIAFYAATDEEAERVKTLFNLQEKEWLKDTVTAMSSVCSEPTEQNVAELQFNYSLGIELEILRYISGPHWHERVMRQNAFISHVGIHLEDGEDFPAMPGCRLVQETWTTNHTSEYLVKMGRTYHYRIYELAPFDYIKFIRRVNK